MANIKLYDKNNQEIVFENFEKMKDASQQGECSNIYVKDDIILKKYKVKCCASLKVKKDMFERLKYLNIPNIVTLYNYYYSYDSRWNSLIPIDAYTMEYIENDNISLLNADKEYLMDIVRNLETTLEILARNRIEIFDVHFNNIILNKNGAKFIDIDSYSVCKFKSYNRILRSNRLELLHYLRSKIREEVNFYEREIPIYQLPYLFSLDYNLTVTDVVKNLYVEKTLGESLESKKI